MDARDAGYLAVNREVLNTEVLAVTVAADSPNQQNCSSSKKMGHATFS
jgi:hypothetical protein